MPATGVVRQLLGVTLAGGVVGIAIGLVASHRSDATAAVPGLPGAEVVGAESTIVAIRGQFSPQALAQVATSLADSTLLVVVRGEDCFTCEDLARQLRELQHASGRQVIVVTRGADSLVVTRWLQRERIRYARLVGLQVERLLDGAVPISTPAVMIVDRDGRILSGVAHPKRAKNVRLRSFAAELGVAQHR